MSRHPDERHKLEVIEEQLKQDYLVSHTPVSRKISKDCQKVLGKDAVTESQSCVECLKLKELRVVNDANVAVLIMSADVIRVVSQNSRCARPVARSHPAVADHRVVGMATRQRIETISSIWDQPGPKSTGT